MPDNQNNLLDYESNDVQGENLLDHLADSEEEPIEQEVVVLKEVQPAGSGHRSWPH